MQTLLPPSKPFRQNSHHNNGWSDHYGALHVATAYAGLPLPARYSINGVWQHGVFGPWQQFSPHVLVYNAPGVQDRPVLVARQDEADLMRLHGYRDVRAIGMPICYVPDPQVQRLPGSLLVVPTHSLTGDNHADRTSFVRYADSIKALVGQFTKITVCVHPNCRRNGLWLEEFSAPNIEIVYGAETSDANALLRMRTLFAQFESVTTNEWGSHVAYALAFGARVSIAGHPIAGNPALYARDLMWESNAEMMTKAFSPEVAEARREFLRRLYVSPMRGIVDVEFGRWFIGWDNRLSPAEMKQALAAMIPHLLEYAEVHRTREQRRVVRQEAARLVQARRKTEALKLLLDFVQQAAATKQALFILETLREISVDLQTLDPTRSAQLQEQASLLTARIETARRTAA